MPTNDGKTLGRAGHPVVRRPGQSQWERSSRTLQEEQPPRPEPPRYSQWRGIFGTDIHRLPSAHTLFWHPNRHSTVATGNWFKAKWEEEERLHILQRRLYGEQNLPQNKMQLVLWCLMKRRKGWSAQNRGSVLTHRAFLTTAVAAAASVPSSLTSTKHLCMTLDTGTLFVADIPEKSALASSKASVIPKLRRKDSKS